MTKRKLMIAKAVSRKALGEKSLPASLIYKRFTAFFSNSLIIIITAVLIVSCGDGSDGGKGTGGDTDGNGGKPKVNTITGIFVNGKAIKGADRSDDTPSAETAVDVRVTFYLPRPEDATAGAGDWSPTDAKVEVGLKDQASADLTGCKDGLQARVNVKDVITADTTFNYNFADDCVVIYTDSSGNEWKYTLGKNPPNGIYDKADWDYFAAKKSSGNYKLLTDIETGEATEAIIKKYSDGTFDGGGHTVTINIADYGDKNRVGLFGTVGDTAVTTRINTTIKDIIVVGTVYTTSTSTSEEDFAICENGRTIKSCIGGLAGFLGATGRIIDATANVKVLGHREVGGLVGLSYGKIISSTANGDVTGSVYVGGLVGWSYLFSVLNSSTASGNVTGYSKVGGLAGVMTEPVDGLTASGDVSADYYVGGLAGQAISKITSSKASGNVYGKERVGGLVGHTGLISNLVSTTADIVIKSSTASGDVSGNNVVGGLVGHASGNIKIISSKASGNVYGNDDVGGIAGRSYGLKLKTSAVSGDVSGTGSRIGGLVGWAKHRTDITGFIKSTMALSYVSGNITGDATVGGLVGNAMGDATAGGIEIISSYVIGNVAGNDNVGGLVGYALDASVNSSYTAGDVSRKSGLKSRNIGGLAGSIGSSSITDSRFKKQEKLKAIGNQNDIADASFDIDGIADNTGFLISEQKSNWNTHWIDSNHNSPAVLPSLPYLSAPSDDSMSDEAKLKWVEDQKLLIRRILGIIAPMSKKL